jgi:hypothetical protein
MPDTEVTMQYLVPLFIVVHRNEQHGLHIAKVVVYDEATLENGEGYTPDGTPLPDDDPLVVEARCLIERDATAIWPGWEFGW